MKYVVIAMALILILFLTLSCTANPEPYTILSQSLVKEVKDRAVAETALTTQMNNLTNTFNNNYKPLADKVNGFNDRMTKIEFYYKDIQTMQSQILTLQDQNKQLQDQLIEINNKITPTAAPASTGGNYNGFGVAIIKSTSVLPNLDNTRGQSADFSITYNNNTGSHLTNIRLQFTITSSVPLVLAGPPTVKDFSNSYLIYDTVWDGASTIYVDFTHSTGSSTVYLDVNQSLIILPVLYFQSTVTTTMPVTFTTVITKLTYDKG